MANPNTLFDSDIDATSQTYINLRDSMNLTELREFAEHLWSRFRPYADSQFRTELAHFFHQRFWEMYLGFGLLEAGLDLKRTPQKAPDFQIQDRDHRVWIEATAPQPGSGPDAVPELEMDVVQNVPQEQIILRLRSAIEEKYRKYFEYQERGVTRKGEPYIIAINGRSIPHMVLDTSPPWIVKALFPIGDPYISINKNTLEKVDEGYTQRYSIKKRSGADVSTTVFSSSEYSEISAVLSCNSDVGNHPPTAAEIGDDFTLVYNPYADNPLRLNLLPCGIEYRVEGELLIRHDKLHADV